MVVEEEIYFAEPLEEQLNMQGYTLDNYAEFFQRLIDISGSFLANSCLTGREYNIVLDMITREVLRFQSFIGVDNKQQIQKDLNNITKTLTD